MLYTTNTKLPVELDTTQYKKASYRKVATIILDYSSSITHTRRTGKQKTKIRTRMTRNNKHRTKHQTKINICFLKGKTCLSEVRVAVKQHPEVRWKGVRLKNIPRHRLAGPVRYRSRCPLGVALISKVGAKVATCSVGFGIWEFGNFVYQALL